jgi:hypothetical protein
LDRPPLAVGLFVRGVIEGREVKDATVLPRSALRDAVHVFVVGPDDRLTFRSIEVLRAERDRVVVGAGLASGERVLISPLPGAIEGMSVRVLDESGALGRVAEKRSGA